jgi:hypothetical protein
MRIELQTDDDTITLIDNRLDKHGDGWIRLDGIKGLYGATKPRESGLAIPQQHGSYWPSRLTAESRTITLDCLTRRESTIETLDLIDRINDMAYQQITILVYDAKGTRYLTGWLADDPQQTLLERLDAFTFTIILYCPDPMRYGPWIEYPATNGLIRVSNEGNIESWPIVKTNNVTSLTLSLGAQQVKWAGTSNPMLLNFADMQPSQGTVLVDDAFSVPLRNSVISASYHTGSVSMLVRPAWR